MCNCNAILPMATCQSNVFRVCFSQNENCNIEIRDAALKGLWLTCNQSFSSTTKRKQCGLNRTIRGLETQFMKQSIEMTASCVEFDEKYNDQFNLLKVFFQLFHFHKILRFDDVFTTYEKIYKKWFTKTTPIHWLPLWQYHGNVSVFSFPRIFSVS